MCTATLELCDSSLAETRLAAIDSCSIIARSYLPSTPAVEQTLDIVNRLLKLQKTYGFLIPYSELTNRGKPDAEKRFVKYLKEAAAESFEEIVLLGELLSIKKEVICELTVKNCSLNNAELYESALL